MIEQWIQCCGPVQFVREFAKLGLTRSVGGVLGLALARELTPVITSIILAGEPSKPGSAGLKTIMEILSPLKKHGLKPISGQQILGD